MAVSAIAVSVQLTEGGDLALCYDVRGAADGMRIPAPRVSGASDGLWRHTCCEAFVAAVDGLEYREFNFSPSGEWAAYRFTAYRERDAGFVPPVAPQLDFRHTADGFHLHARIPGALLPPSGAWQVGLNAVIEAADGATSYWALAHAAAQPDFHHPQSFTLPLNIAKP